MVTIITVIGMGYVGRNVFEEDTLVSHDFEYRAVGKVGLKR